MRNVLREGGALAFELGVAVGVDDDNEVVLIDYDQDGDLDALIGSLGPREKILENLGDLRFAMTEGVIEPFEDPTLDVSVADLDNDRAADVVTAQGLERIGAEQPPCVLYRNLGPRDRRPPRIVAEQELENPSPPEGPWVVHATVQDGVVDDGQGWVRGGLRYVLSETPRVFEQSIDDSDDGPAAIEVESGTSVTWTNAREETLRLTGTGVLVDADSGDLAPGESWSQTFVLPGRYALDVADSWPNLDGVAHRVDEDFAVTDIAGAGMLDDGVDGRLRLCVMNHQL